MDVLAKLFGSNARVKTLRLILFNKDSKFTITEAAYRSKVSKESARKELELFARIKLVKKQKRGKEVVYSANDKFEHYEQLKAFFRRTTELKRSEVIKSIKHCGVIKLLLLSGTLTDTPESSIDLLIVGDRIVMKKLERAIRTLEAELGQELTYATFSTQDFNYRLGVYDRLLRDVIEYPHITLVDKIGVSN
ncbi:hypothetical protein COB87_000630 [Candidatus Wolfebacteria bacterium]|nr:hypothetical protein [Candidatus Wolfebacteria bacterium]